MVVFDKNRLPLRLTDLYQQTHTANTRNIHLSKDPACHSFEGTGNLLLIIKIS